MGLRECGVAVRCWKPSLKEQLPEGLPWSSLIPHPPKLGLFQTPSSNPLPLHPTEEKSALPNPVANDLQQVQQSHAFQSSKALKCINWDVCKCLKLTAPFNFPEASHITAFYFTHYLSCYHITTKHLCCFLIAFLLQLFINDAPLNYANVATDKGIIHGLGKVLEIKKNRCDINDTVITVSGSVCIDA